MRRIFRRHIRKTLAQEVPPILQEAIFAFDKANTVAPASSLKNSRKRRLPAVDLVRRYST